MRNPFVTAFARRGLAALLAATTGCLSVGPRSPAGGSHTDSPAKLRVQAVLPTAAEMSLTTEAAIPSRQCLDQSGHANNERSEQRFRYVFRMVKDGTAWHQDRDKSWALPAAEYTRVIRAVYLEAWAAAEAGGGTLTEYRCDGSTFLIRYRATTAAGVPVAGTLRGWIGPEDLHGHQPPLTEPYYTQLAVDVREELDSRKPHREPHPALTLPRRDR